MLNLFQLKYYNTDSDNKYKSDYEQRFSYLADKQSIFQLYFILKYELKKKHVEVYSMNGIKQKPEDGYDGLHYENL